MPVRPIHLFCLICLVISLFLYTGIFLITSAPAHAQATDSPITILSETDSISYPNSIAFQLKAQDTIGPITQANISITADIAGSTSNTLESVAVAQAATTVSLNWQWATTGDNFLVPGTHITYYWQLQDNSGTHTLPSQQFYTSDTRFSWQQRSQGMVQINWYNNSSTFGQGLLSQAASDVARISHNLGGSPTLPLHIWVYQSDNDFRGALPPGTFEWVGGIAFPSLDECFIVVNNLNNYTVIRDMPHEMTHLIFHQLVTKGIEPPVWFDEGLAVYNQLYHEPAMTARLNEALTAQNLIPLNQLYFNFPANADQAELAYAQSWNLVSYMYKTFGVSKMAALIHAINNPNYDFSEDLQHTIGEDTDHLENQWHLSLHQSPTLSAGQQNSTQVQTTTTPIKVQLNDGNQSFYILLGLLLIFVPIVGGIALFAYIRRSQAPQPQVAQITGYQTPPASNYPDYPGYSYYSQPTYIPPVLTQPYIQDRQNYTGSLPYMDPASYIPTANPSLEQQPEVPNRPPAPQE